MEAPNINTNKSLKQWQDAIREGIRYRMLYGRSKEWTEYKSMYRGHWKQNVIPVNIIYALGRSLIPQVYFRNPRINVSPAKPGFAPHAMVVDRIDNYLLRELGVKRELKSQVLDCYLMGRGPGIIGYDSEYGFSKKFMGDEAFGDASLTGFDKKGQKIEYSDFVKPGMPWFMRCSPTDFIVPWGSAKWEDAPWFAFRKMRMLDDIKADPKYKNKSNLKAAFKSKLDTTTDTSPEAYNTPQEKEGTGAWVELWQVHDKKSGHVFGITLDHQEYLRDEEDLLQTENLPSYSLGFNEDPDYYWWAPDARMIKEQQAELNDVRTMAKAHRKVALVKMIVDSTIKDDELVKLLDGDPKAAVKIDAGTTGDIRKSVAFLTSHVPPDLITAAAEIREDVREIIGFSRNQMGAFESPGGRRTAYETEVVRAASMIRIDERRDVMTDHLEKIVRHFNQLIFANWGAQRVIDIVGPDGVKYWVKVTGRELKGEFNYKINPEEAIPENAMTRKKEAMEFMQVAQNTPGINMQYLMRAYAEQVDWLDAAQLFGENSQGATPENAMGMQELMAKYGGGGSAVTSSYPGLEYGG